MKSRTLVSRCCSLLLFCFLLSFASAVAQQAGRPPQDKSSRPSPPAKATCTLDDGASHIIVDYSSPRAKGRKIYGELVPYGQPWRLGANEATTFANSAQVKVGGTTVPPGSYTLFVIPNADKWTLIISKKTGEWGVPYPGADSDFARVDMKVSKLSSRLENFTIDFDNHGSGCTLRAEWENTRASVEITK